MDAGVFETDEIGVEKNFGGFVTFLSDLRQWFSELEEYMFGLVSSTWIETAEDRGEKTLHLP